MVAVSPIALAAVFAIVFRLRSENFVDDVAVTHAALAAYDVVVGAGEDQTKIA